MVSSQVRELFSFGLLFASKSWKTGLLASSVQLGGTDPKVKFSLSFIFGIILIGHQICASPTY